MRKLGLVVACATAAATLTRVPFAQSQNPRGLSASDGGDEAGDAGVRAQASMQCERVDSPGRVRCQVEARVDPGESIAWGDVILLRAPPFVRALRARIGPREATTRESEVWRWALALAARANGSGDVDGRVRLVVCRGDRCAPRQLAVTASVVAGGDRNAGRADAGIFRDGSP